MIINLFIFLIRVLVTWQNTIFSIANFFIKKYNFLLFNNALVPYDPFFLTKMNDELKKKNYFKKNFLLAFFIILCGFVNSLISCNLELIARADFFTMDYIVDGNFPFLFDSINKSIVVFIVYHYSYLLYFISFFFLIIPLINGTYKFYFKKLFIFSILMYETGFFFLIYSTTWEIQTFRWWVDYVFFKCLSEFSMMSVASTFLILNFVFLASASFLIGLIFIYNIFFKKAKHLFFFTVLKFSFFIILASFTLVFHLAPVYVLLACLLTSYNLRQEIIAWGNYPYMDDFWTYDNIFYYFYNPIECFYIFSTLAVAIFIYREQYVLKQDVFNHKIFFGNYIKIWFILILFFYALTYILKKNFVYLLVATRINLRFGILLFVFFLLIYFLLKNFYLESLTPIFFSLFVFLTFFMILVVFMFFIYTYVLISDERGLYFYSPFYHFIRLFILWSMIAFFHQFLDYFLNFKLNFGLIVIEFFFLILGSLIVFLNSLRHFYKYFFCERLLIGYSKIPVETYEFFVRVQLHLCDWGYRLIYFGFFLAIISVFLIFIVNKLKIKKKI